MESLDKKSSKLIREKEKKAVSKYNYFLVLQEKQGNRMILFDKKTSYVNERISKEKLIMHLIPTNT